jgi:osmotically-inducible protein OsmY
MEIALQERETIHRDLEAPADSALLWHDIAVIDRMLDVWLTEQAQQAVHRCWMVPARAVELSVSEGWVTIAGVVPHLYQRMAAIRALRDVKGVCGVFDLMTVNRLDPD